MRPRRDRGKLDLNPPKLRRANGADVVTASTGFRVLPHCAWLVICYVVPYIRRGANMRGILGLVVTVVVIVIVLRFLGVI